MLQPKIPGYVTRNQGTEWPSAPIKTVVFLAGKCPKVSLNISQVCCQDHSKVWLQLILNSGLLQANYFPMASHHHWVLPAGPYHPKLDVNTIEMTVTLHMKCTDLSCTWLENAWQLFMLLTRPRMKTFVISYTSLFNMSPAIWVYTYSGWMNVHTQVEWKAKYWISNMKIKVHIFIVFAGRDSKSSTRSFTWEVDGNSCAWSEKVVTERSSTLDYFHASVKGVGAQCFLF